MTNSSQPSWQIWVDTGGTFTDCIAQTPFGETMRLKILSSGVLRGKIIKSEGKEVYAEMIWSLKPDIFSGFTFKILKSNFSSTIEKVDFNRGIIFLKKKIPSQSKGLPFEISSGEEVPVLAARLLTSTGLKKDFPPLEMKLGSTRGTNAILERKGARTAFITTKGFKDLLLIGNQQRPDLFALHIIKQKPLYDLVIEAEERIKTDGNVLKSLKKKDVTSIISKLKKNKITSVAIGLLNSYKNSVHETTLADALQRAGFKYVSSSHVLSSQIKILSRAETAIANAYLDPIIHQYLSGIRKCLSGAKLSVMTSAGNLVRSDSFFPKDSLLSGPAGGVVGAAIQAQQSGITRIIAFDMGGTSTDVSLYNGRFDYRFESHVGNFKILSPSLAIETIAAGGGSICDFDGHLLTVGPHSAGASPGPACYGAGGPLTITDVNVLLGRLDPNSFAIPIDYKKSEEALNVLGKKIKRITGRRPEPKALLESLVQIANEKMAEAIKKISIQQGHDPQEFTLLSFGGAGGQHACALASMLKMKGILAPYDAGLLSAYGIGQAAVEKFEEQLILSTWKSFSAAFENATRELYQKAQSKLISEGFSENQITQKSTLLFLRLAGQDATLEIDYKKGDAVLDIFQQKYISIFGHWVDREVEIESIRVVASVANLRKEIWRTHPATYQPTSQKQQPIFSGGKKSIGEIFRWEDLKSGASVEGPALIVSGNSTTFVERHWIWSLDDINNAHLIQTKKISSQTAHSAAASLELFTNRFTALAQDMGALLQRTSFSVNVKERLDFSCAILDADGYLVINAPHIPVHLGSMGVCVREVRKVIAMNEGDVIITNHPAYGGSHLPDVTLIKPVFNEKRLVGYVVNRAHHAEIGGRKPGSMPADAKTLVEEGVIIAPAYLVKTGKAQWEFIKQILSAPPYPTRSIEENLADLNGALAAVNQGEQGLQELCHQHGEKEVTHHMIALRKHAAQLLSEKIKSFKKTTFKATERLDDGSQLCVHATRKGGRLIIDFNGTSGTHPGNLNATPAIVQSVVLYVLRLLVGQNLPMNEGLMEPVKLIIPKGLLNPDFTVKNLPAIVGGNTEVSQRLTDTLLKAFGLAACSQGTMNNFLFGNERFGYYETICGGTGAVNGFPGADAVHQHMTNTRITDPELLEIRYPVRLERFEIRKNSGGKGKWRGGDGIEREIFFKESLEINLLTQHRIERPYGSNGGEAGKTGEQFIIRASGKKEKIKGMDSASVQSGDRLIIKTPGGGAWGKY